jgi:hypothetical protein
MMNDPRVRADDLSPRKILIATLLVAVASLAFFIGRLTAANVIDAARDAKPIPRALPEDVSKFHDASEKVTCWKLNNGYGRDVGISCLPDLWLASARAQDDVP